MTATRLYDTCLERLKHYHPDKRITQLRLLAWIMTGLFQSRSPLSYRIGAVISGLAKTVSKAERVRRWFNNGRIRVRDWYLPVAKEIIARAENTIHLVIDCSKVGNTHQLLMIAVAWKHRSLPVAWTWVRHSKGHSSAFTQKALLGYVAHLVWHIPCVTIVGDSEFGSISVQRLLDQFEWQYVFRQPGHHLVDIGDGSFVRLDTLIEKPKGRQPNKAWFSNVQLTKEHAYSTNIAIVWFPNEEAPWILATNFSTLRQTLKHYQRRMWIEEMFGDFKGSGFDLEATRLRSFLALSRLTLAVAFLYVFIAIHGQYAVKRGWRHFVDRKTRRDRSYFRIGYAILNRLLTNQSAIPRPFALNF